MSGDIEEFLRRAAARRANRTPNAPASQPAPPQRSQQQASQPLIINERGNVESDVVDLTQVASHELESQFDGETSSRLGSGLSDAIEQRDADRAQRFDHDLGGLLSASETGTPVHEDVNISDIAEILRNPESIRQAIILTEILRPPTERW